MDVEEALRTRRSTRAFLPTPVPRARIERLLALATHSASNSNSQPWHVHVLTGAAKRALAEAIWEVLDADGRMVRAEYPYQPTPDSWAEPFRTRRAEFGSRLYHDTLGCAADDIVRRDAHHRRNYDFFGAPVGIVLTVSSRPLAGALVDAGLFLQALMLAARHDGLDTCPQASFIDFSPVLRQHLPVPDDHVIVCGLALGYADPTHGLNGLRTPREPVDRIATFHEDR